MEAHCRICGDVSDGLHFTVPACRACTAFFRRSVAQSKRYTCRFGGNCDIGKDVRCFCRACRLQKCLAVGMKPCSVQLSRDELGRHEKRVNFCPRTPDSVSSSAAASSITATPVTSPLGVAAAILVSSANSPTTDWVARNPITISCKEEEQQSVISDHSTISHNGPQAQIRFGSIESLIQSPQPQWNLLSRMLDGYHSLLVVRRAARNLTSNTALHRIFDDKNALTPGTMDDSMRSFRADVTLVSDMINEYFDPFPSLPTEQKWLFFKNFFATFICTDRSFLTWRMFPSPDDHRVAISAEKYYTSNNLVAFFTCESSKSDPVEVAKMFAPSFEKWNRLLVKRMIEMRLTETELVAIYGLQLWCETVDGLTPSSIDILRSTRDRIFIELHQHLSDRLHSSAEIGRRFGSILTLCSLCEESARKIGEDFSVAKVFNVYSLDAFSSGFFPT